MLLRKREDLEDSGICEERKESLNLYKTLFRRGCQIREDGTLYRLRSYGKLKKDKMFLWTFGLCMTFVPARCSKVLLVAKRK